MKRLSFFKHIYRRAKAITSLAIAFALLVVWFGTGLTATTSHTGVPATGIICTTNPSATFTLTAKEGYISMTDGNTIYMWGYADGNGDFQYPGPVLCVNQGDTVTVVFHNTLREPASIMFPGQEDVTANDIPVQPEFTSGKLTSLTTSAPAKTGSVTYLFVAKNPGTYLYESGTNSAVQVQLGLVGALIVRPTLGANYAYNRADTQFNPETEYLDMLSEIDPIMHQAYERGQDFDMTQYKARYFLINGRTFPDTIAPNHASWLPSQPYGSLAHIHPNDASNPLPALARYIGLGVETYPFHPHAFNGRVIGRDGHPLEGPAGQDLSYEKFSISVSPGQTTDSLFMWKDTYGFKPDTNPVPVTMPNEQNLTIGPFWGSAYLGNQDVLPVGTVSYNQCGEFYHIAHNHALQQITGWGVTLIGQVTFTRIDPPLPNNCPAN